MKNSHVIFVVALVVARGALATDLTPSASLAPPVGPNLAAPATNIERNWSSAAEHVRAPAAHSVGVTGAGVTISVIDTGVNANHLELYGRVDTMRAWNATSGSPGSLSDGYGHGTHVASIIAANKNDVGFYGVAFDARILPIQVFSAPSWTASDNVIAAGINYSIGKAFINNLSMAASGGGPNQRAALLASVQAGQLNVVAAGNRGLDNPDWPGRYAKEGWANGQIIVVGAVDANNRITAFSNRAGDTSNWFLVAPGDDMVGASASASNGYVYSSGTSLAAPVVSGAAALVKSAWPHLSAKQVADILFTTATDLGEYGTDAVYGRGLVNVQRAMLPVGTLNVMTSDGTPIEATRAGFMPGFAYRAAMTLAGHSGALTAAALDSYGRDFRYDLSHQITPIAPMTAEQIFGNSDRQLLFTDQVIDDQGSRMMMALDASRSDVTLGSLHAYENRYRAQNALAGFAYTKRFADGGELACGTLGMQNFFGLAATRFDDAPALNLPGLSNNFYQLVPSATTLGVGMRLSETTSLKFGAMTSTMSQPLLSQLGFDTPINHSNMAIAELARNTGATSLGLQVSQLNEQRSYLGSYSQDAFAIHAAPMTTVVTFNAAWRVMQGLALGAYYSAGVTQSFSNTGSSLVAGASAARTNAFGVGLVKSKTIVDGDRLALSVTQPMRTTGGSLNLDMPVALNDSGALLREMRYVNLAPTARELLSEVSYYVPTGKVSGVLTSVINRRNPGHFAELPNENIATVRFSAQF